MNHIVDCYDNNLQAVYPSGVIKYTCKIQTYVVNYCNTITPLHILKYLCITLM